MVKLIKKVRDAVLERNSRVRVDFGEKEILNAGGVLLFVAELDRMRRIVGDYFDVTIENVRVTRVAQVLRQIGIYDFCKGSKIPPNGGDFGESVRHWRYATGVRADNETTEAFESIEGRLSPKLAKGMWKGISEAVVNSVEHAYLQPRFVDAPRMRESRWWMFSQERDGVLSVVVCDLGIGISRSLPLNWEPGLIDRILGKTKDRHSDSKAIEAALEVGKTSTGENNRGKGLPQIWETFTEQNEDSAIVIMSNKGQVGKSDGKSATVEYNTSIDGTIIIWKAKTVDARPADAH